MGCRFYHDCSKCQKDEEINDLIYGGAEYKDELLRLFPNAEIEDASDDIHEGRISITVPDISEEEYWEKICLNGFMKLSLNLVLVMHDKEKSNRLVKCFEKWKIEKSEYFKPTTNKEGERDD